MPAEYRGITFVGTLGGTVYNSVSNPSYMLDGNPITYATYVQHFNGPSYTSYSYLVFRVPASLRFYGIKVTAGLERFGNSTSGNPQPFLLCVALFSDYPYIDHDRGGTWSIMGISRSYGVFSNFYGTTQSPEVTVLPVHPCSYYIPGQGIYVSYTPTINSTTSYGIPFVSSTPSGTTLTFVHNPETPWTGRKPNTSSSYYTDWGNSYNPVEDGSYRGLFPPFLNDEFYLVVGIIPPTLYGSQTNTFTIYLRIFDVCLLVPSTKGDWYVYDTTEQRFLYDEKFTDSDLSVFIPSISSRYKVVGFFRQSTYVKQLYLRARTTLPSGYTILKFWDNINLNFENPGDPIATVEVFGSLPKTISVPMERHVSAIHIGT